MIISILNLKGGVGKTTIAVNLALGLAKRKKRTLLLDTDSQRSSMQWYDRREKAEPHLSVASVTEANSLKKQLPNFTGIYDCVIVDGAPQIDTTNAVCVILSDLIIIPLTPSPLDLWATKDFLERVEKAQTINENLKVMFVINRYNDQTKISRDTSEAIESFGFTIAKTKLRNRVIYADSVFGTSVLESSNKKAREEFEALITEIRKQTGL